MDFSFTLENIHDVEKEIWYQIISKNPHIGLVGEMGSGKTTFCKGLLHFLNYQKEVTSPTFSIVQEYTITNNEFYDIVYHFDLYRIVESEELWEIGFDEYLQKPRALCIIEWPEKGNEFYDNIKYLIFEKIDEHTRTIHIDDNI